MGGPTIPLMTAVMNLTSNTLSGNFPDAVVEDGT